MHTAGAGRQHDTALFSCGKLGAQYHRGFVFRGSAQMGQHGLRGRNGRQRGGVLYALHHLH